MATIRNMLVPVDGSPPSIAALEHAVELAIDNDTRVDALHVEAPGTEAVEARRLAEEEMDLALQRAEGRLGDRLSRLRVAGEPLRKILETAAEGEYQLIVIGTHGRIGRLHELVGSVAEGVVRNAPCPVLTVREPGADYQSFAERRHSTPSLGEQIERHH